MDNIHPLDRSVESLKGVGEVVAKKLSQLGIKTIKDLILNFPRKYDDYSRVTAIQKIRPGSVTIKAQVTSVSGRYVRRGMHITEALASDETGTIRLVWFNQPYRLQSLQKDAEYYISGEFGLRRQRMVITNPSIELVSSFPLHTARIVPVYRETSGIKSTQIRRFIQQAIPEIRTLPETLPDWIIAKFKFMSYAKAVEEMHFPSDTDQFIAARHRLAFEEVFQLTLSALLNKNEYALTNSVVIGFDESVAREYVRHLPFTLTDDQRRVIWQIYQDMQRPQPMNRLVEGDVGSGKTVVAAMAALMVMQQEYQVALMAPTEILARQHARSIRDQYKRLQLDHAVGLLVGGMSAAKKRELHDQIITGEKRLLIGTHALFQESVQLPNLGLVIVDEQHRFGVSQRRALQAKSGYVPHVLSLSATPIPRSLALTLYGELDISVLRQKPPGRLVNKTEIVPLVARPAMYQAVLRELDAGRQAFVVCPLIDNSQKLAHKSVMVAHKEMSSAFPSKKIAILHGRMKAVEKDSIMTEFANGGIDILIATTVIEVGVDVPNATVMIIESAERFGLAQIHQLRGRVGRSGHQGYCYLLLDDNATPSRRLHALESSADGFSLAELDLEIRGPGAIYGTAQHGALDLKIASLTDTALIASARSVAQMFIDSGEDLLQYPQLQVAVEKLRKITNLN